MIVKCYLDEDAVQKLKTFEILDTFLSHSIFFHGENTYKMPSEISKDSIKG